MHCKITLFTCPKAFHGHIGTIQSNAIKSWTLLEPRPEILLFGDEDGTAEAAVEFGALHIPAVGRNSHGTPLISSIFHLAQENASTNLVCYVNCDIIFLDNFGQHVQKIGFPTFLLVGQRTNLDVNYAIDFSAQRWHDSIRGEALQHGKKGGFAAIDYFIFSKGLYNSIPDFAVGRIGWDNWLLWKTKSMGVPIVDATNAVSAIHQNHSYEHLTGGEVEFRHGSEAKVNLELAGGWKHYHNIEDAEWAFRRGELRRHNLGLWRILRKIERLIVVRQGDSNLEKLFQKVVHPQGILRKTFSLLRRKRPR